MSGQDVKDAYERKNWWREGYEPLPDDQCMPARAVLLNVDSPGGEAAGTMAAHRKLRSLRKQYRVPMFGFSNETACSAAYALISACDGIYLPDIARVGSIGVVATLFDRTKANSNEGLLVELITSGEYKSDGHADRPLTDGIRERMQYQVDLLAGVFWDTVARARTRATGVKVTPKYVASLQAGVFIGADAVDAGIADAVCDWDEALERVRASLSDSESGEGEPQMPDSGSDNAQLSP